MCDNSAVPDDQAEQPAAPRRGRPRKWPSEAARREHEAAKRRLRNKATMTPEDFDDVVRLTALADDLQRQLAAATNEVERLRQRTSELERRLTEGSSRLRPTPEPPSSAPASSSLPVMNRQQRREAERAQRRTSGQPERSPTPI
jgi:hypothetical protein